MKHYSVLKNEAILGLNIHEDGLYVDATLGYAGDAKEILQRIKRGHLFAFDRDKDAILYSQEVLEKISSSFTLIHEDFVHMKEELKQRGIDRVDGILFDLGVSSPQLDEAERGFSFHKDAKLDMRMNQDSYEELRDLFYRYGEEKKSSLIAKKIVEERSQKPFETTFALRDVIKAAVGSKYFYDTHPERNIFQAIRIEVNDELKDLETVLPEAISLLKPKGRLVVITFHSLEDRIVKQIFKKESEVDPLVKGLPTIPLEYQPRVKIINKKPILPSLKELEENSRSKSAKLRIIERI